MNWVKWPVDPNYQGLKNRSGTFGPLLLIHAKQWMDKINFILQHQVGKIALYIYKKYGFYRG